MSLISDENPTRKKIIMLLKKAEHLTVAELSKEMSITSMAVRQHLMSLEKRGIINYTTRKYGIGRPVFLYRLTERALDFFPKAYSSFAKEVLRSVETMDGREKVVRIFDQRKNRLFGEYKSLLDSYPDVGQRANAFAEMLDKAGYMVDVDNATDTIEFKQFNCLLHDVVGDYPEACEFELALYRDILGDKVERIECQRDGFPACTYSIPIL